MKKILYLFMGLALTAPAICSSEEPIEIRVSIAVLSDDNESIDVNAKYVMRKTYRDLIEEAASKRLYEWSRPWSLDQVRKAEFKDFVEKYGSPPKSEDKISWKLYTELLDYIAQVSLYNFKIYPNQISYHGNGISLTPEQLAHKDLLEGLEIIRRNALRNGFISNL